MELQALIEKVTQEIMQSLDQQKVPVADKPAMGQPASPAALAVDECALSLLSELKAAYPQAEIILDARDRITSRNIFYPVVNLTTLSAFAQFNPVTPLIAEILRRFEASQCRVTLLLAIPQLSPGLEKVKSRKLDDIAQAGFEVQMLKSLPQAAAPVPGEAPACACPAATGECAGCGQCAQLIPDKVNKVVEAGAERLAGAPGVSGINQEVARMIDHTLLKPDATKEQVIKLCDEARRYNFASVCINPGFVKLSSECLKGCPAKVCTVIGFPLGATTSVAKAIETRDAIANGAQEIDMVINVGALKARDYELVRKDIEAVVEAANGKIVKVILETALLTDEEKIKGCQLAKEAGADFVKTSTGFGPGGATAHDIALMRETVGKYMGVKASGGIRDFATAQEMIKAGATRIGASASVSIVKGETQVSKGY